MKSNQKKFEGDFKIKLCGKRLYLTENINCLGEKVDANLSSKFLVNGFSIKLNRRNVLLFKIGDYVSLKNIKTHLFFCF